MGVDLPNLGEVLQKVPSVSALAKLNAQELKAKVPGLPLGDVPKLLQAAREEVEAQKAAADKAEAERKAAEIEKLRQGFGAEGAPLFELLKSQSVELLKEVRPCRYNAVTSAVTNHRSC